MPEGSANLGIHHEVAEMGSALRAKQPDAADASLTGMTCRWQQAPGAEAGATVGGAPRVVLAFQLKHRPSLLDGRSGLPVEIFPLLQLFLPASLGQRLRITG
jgi:hypothetical protein